jgi:hypothetical protein
LNEDEVAFNLLTAAEVFPSEGGGFEDLPLKGGMAWMTKFDRLTGDSDLTEVFVAVCWADFEDVGLVAVLTVGTGW